MPRALLILLLTGLALTLLLGGCAAPQRLQGAGEIALPPIGHTVACAKDPGLAGCPK